MLTRLSRIPTNIKQAYAQMAGQGSFKYAQPVYISANHSLCFVPKTFKFGALVPRKNFAPGLSFPVFKTIGHLAKYVWPRSRLLAQHLLQGTIPVYEGFLPPNSDEFITLENLAEQFDLEILALPGKDTVPGLYFLDNEPNDTPLYPNLVSLAEAESPPVRFTKGEVGEGAIDTWAYGLTHIGSGKRTNNEDSLIMDNGLFIVADGMGGHSSGELASHLGSLVTYFCLKHHLPFAIAVKMAHRAIKIAAAKQHNNMGTTLVGAKIVGNEANIFHVGDSRAYLFQHRTQQLLQLTADHSLVYGLFATNPILSHLTVPYNETTQTEIENFLNTMPLKNVLSHVLGQGNPQLALFKQPLEAKDIILLCSDGLSGPLPCLKLKTIINSALSKGASLQQIAEDLLAACLATGLADDNITVALYRHSRPRGLLGHIKNWLPF